MYADTLKKCRKVERYFWINIHENLYLVSTFLYMKFYRME